MKREKVNILLVDDDELNLGINQKCVELISEQNSVEIELHTFSSITKEMISLIEAGEVDLAVLDIDLKQGSGIDIARKLQEVNKMIPIMFVTSYEEYKSLAWDIMAVGFLDKPLNPEKFELIYLRALALVEEERRKKRQNFIELVVDKRPVKMRVANIICMEKVQRKVEFRTSKGCYAVWGNLSDYENKLDSRFIKISQSVIINKEKILSMDNNSIYLTNGDEYSIGRTYLKRVRDAYMNQS